MCVIDKSKIYSAFGMNDVHFAVSKGVNVNSLSAVILHFKERGLLQQMTNKPNKR